MIRRGFWLTAGAVTGIYGYRRVAAARETYRFTRDVREGMDLYRRAHPAPAGPALSTSQTRSTRQTRAANRTDHEPEDGH